jgi:hypothetical protein
MQAIKRRNCFAVSGGVLDVKQPLFVNSLLVP